METSSFGKSPKSSPNRMSKRRMLFGRSGDFDKEPYVRRPASFVAQAYLRTTGIYSRFPPARLFAAAILVPFAFNL